MGSQWAPQFHLTWVSAALSSAASFRQVVQQAQFSSGCEGCLGDECQHEQEYEMGMQHDFWTHILEAVWPTPVPSQSNTDKDPLAPQRALGVCTEICWFRSLFSSLQLQKTVTF